LDGTIENVAAAALRIRQSIEADKAVVHEIDAALGRCD